MIRKFFRSIFSFISKILLATFVLGMIVIGLLGIIVLAFPISVTWLLSTQEQKDKVLNKIDKL